ncbi:MAG TPA: hypothetical protein VK196_06210 [Magnetospirillum sp.]|nr:hypothetical protein [Magnetospirillum sp.]
MGKPHLLFGLLLLTACAPSRGLPDPAETARLPPPTASGGNYMRDGFYDGGIDDPDQTPRAMALPE